MNTIYLIRHAQASAHAKDYDQLSDHGFLQTELLSTALKQLRPSAVYYGPRKRHRQTAEGCWQSHWPEPRLWSALDEYPAMEMLSHCLDQIAALDPALANDVDKIKAHSGSAGNSYASVLKSGAHLWMTEKLSHPQLESYSTFSQRVSNICQRCESFEEGPVLCFSSAGLISAVLSAIFGGTPELSFRTAWALFNTSISEVIAHQGLTVAAINRIDHIDHSNRTHI